MHVQSTVTIVNLTHPNSVGLKVVGISQKEKQHIFNGVLQIFYLTYSKITMNLMKLVFGKSQQSDNRGSDK